LPLNLVFADDETVFRLVFERVDSDVHTFANIATFNLVVARNYLVVFDKKNLADAKSWKFFQQKNCSKVVPSAEIFTLASSTNSFLPRMLASFSGIYCDDG
jgi:hypothetical protein